MSWLNDLFPIRESNILVEKFYFCDGARMVRKSESYCRKELAAGRLVWGGSHRDRENAVCQRYVKPE